MPKYSDDPVPHIITFRINSEEKEALEQQVKKSGRSISDFMRRKLQMLSEGDIRNK